MHTFKKRPAACQEVLVFLPVVADKKYLGHGLMIAEIQKLTPECRLHVMLSIRRSVR